MLKSTMHGSHMDARARRCREMFLETRGEAETVKREAEIAALPVVIWKGRTLYTLRCHGDYGKGPHDMNVPLYVPWALIDFRAFRCPYHVT